MLKESRDGKIVLAYIEGDQLTLREALQQFGAAVSRRMSPQVKTVIAVPANGKALPAGADYEVPNEEPGDQDEQQLDVSAESQKPKTKGPRKPAKVPDLLPDEDLTSNEISFRDFATKLNPSTQFYKYLVIAAWFKRYKSVNEITIRHIYSCYQLMKWQSPDELSTPFRDMKRLHNYFSKGKDTKDWVLTLVGSNEVDDLERTPTAA